MGSHFLRASSVLKPISPADTFPRLKLFPEGKKFIIHERKDLVAVLASTAIVTGVIRKSTHLYMSRVGLYFGKQGPSKYNSVKPHRNFSAAGPVYSKAEESNP